METTNGFKAEQLTHMEKLLLLLHRDAEYQAVVPVRLGAEDWLNQQITAVAAPQELWTLNQDS